jgi:hypothetical protein
MCSPGQGVRDKAHVLCFFEQTHCLGLVGPGGHFEHDRLIKIGKLRDFFNPVENGIDIAAYREPIELRGARDCPE